MSTNNVAEQVSQWLSAIDAGREPQASEARRELSVAGIAAMAPVLRSLDEINNALLRQQDFKRNMVRLGRRVEILATMPDEQVVMPILRAVVDSSNQLESCKIQTAQIRNQMEQSGSWPGSDLLTLEVEDVRNAAAWLKRTSMAALAGFGEMSLPHVERSLPQAPACAQRPLKAVRARILKQWWKFWLWF